MKKSHLRVQKSEQGKVWNAAQAGFSLVELMVVVTIIGILATVAVPKFQTFKARATQTEAKSGLNGIFLAVQSYQANYNELPPTVAAKDPATVPELGFSIVGTKPKYGYMFVSAGATGWAAVASSLEKINTKTDNVRINTNKWVCNPFDAVSGVAATEEKSAFTATTSKMCPQKGDGSAAITVAVQTNDAPQ